MSVKVYFEAEIVLLDDEMRDSSLPQNVQDKIGHTGAVVTWVTRLDLPVAASGKEER